MTVIAAVEAVALVAVVVLFLRHIAQIEARNALERRELANRIQAPERLPVGEVDWQPVDDDEPDEIQLVGTVMEPKESD